MRQKTGKVAAAIVSGCALYIFLLYLLLNCFIIFPDSSYISPQQAGIPRFQEKPFTADDGTKIMCWYAKGNPDKPAILFFHGNAGQIATFSLQMAAYLRKGYSVMMPEYRGFASTPGEFSQENIYRDGAAAYDFLHRQLGHSDIIIVGYSMGAAAAAAVAAQRPAQGLVLAAPFYSLKKIVSEKPVPGAALILKNELPSYRFVSMFRKPLFIVHGAEDRLIPPSHGKALYGLSPSKDRELKILAGQSHNALFFEDDGHKAILDWLSRH